MLAEGKTQRKLRNTTVIGIQVVKSCSSVRQERNASRKPGVPRPKGRPRKMLHQERLWQSRLVRFGGCLENSLLRDFSAIHRKEVTKKYAVIPPQERVPHTGYVQILFGVQKPGIISFVKRMNQPDVACRDNPTAGQMLSHLRLSENVAMAEENEGIYHNPKTILRVMQKIRPAGRNSSPQVAADGPGGTQIRESQPGLSR